MRRLAAGIVLLVVVAGIVLYAAGVFGGARVEPGRTAEPPGVTAPPSSANAERLRVPIHEDAVGTVRSRTRVEIAAQVTARIAELRADAGQKVEADAELVVLDDRELAARVDQARQTLAAAVAAKERAEQSKASQEALLTRAKAAFDRIERLIAKGAATTEEREAAEATFLAAEARTADAAAAISAADAQILRAKKVVAEAEVAFGHARIASPIQGVVAERNVERGDLAWPGRTLLVVLNPNTLRIEAEVREGLIGAVEEGQTLQVDLPSAGHTVEGKVAEILPSADPRSRTFRVRVNLPPLRGVYPGMFGRLRIPVGTREAVAVPRRAVVQVGQLETLVVRSGGRWERRFVTTGSPLADGKVEILSGLAGGEEVGVGAEPR